MNAKFIPEDWGKSTGTETRQSWNRLFTKHYQYFNLSPKERLAWGEGLELGSSGYSGEKINTVFPNALSLNLGDEGYDGRTIPYPDNKFDYVYSSHVLEHIHDYKNAIQEWHRVTKVGGHIIIVVPHQYLYEKKASLPSKWNGSHLRFYTGSSLLKEVEESLKPNSYRVRVLEDNDAGFLYSIPPETHSCGEYAIMLVLEKIILPGWDIK